MRIIVSLFVCLAFFALPLAAAEPSWPVFHGPKGDNISPETGLLKAWPEDGPKLLWKADGLGTTDYPGYSGVTVSDGRLFTTGNVKTGSDRKPANAFVYALDAKTGRKLWEYDNGPGWTGHYEGDRSTPTVDGDRVYALSALGRLVCLDVKDGRKIWDRDLVAEYDVKLPTWVYAESVVVDGDKVVAWIGSKKAAVVAMDKRTGKTIWETPGSDELAGYATMLIFEQDGLRIYVNTTEKGMLGVDAADGKRLFYHEHRTQYDINATMPYYFDGKILLSSGYGSGTELVKLTIRDGKATTEQLWHQKNLDNQHGGLVVLDGHVYGSSHHYKGGLWLCLKLEDGSVAWENRGVGKGGITCADGMLYCMAESTGQVALVKPDPAKYDEVGRFELPEEGAGMFWAHPVVCGGRLYLRHAGFLYCYSVVR